MIRLLQVKNFRMLRSSAVELLPYQVLVGQNATGKSTFLGSLQFLSDIVSQGLRYAVESVASSLYDLCFDPAEPISLAVELTVPQAGARERRLRYAIEIGITEEQGLQVLEESLLLLAPSNRWRQVIGRTREGSVTFHAEAGRKEYTVLFAPEEAALRGVLGATELFPLAAAVRAILREGVRTLQLDAIEMRSVSPAGGQSRLELDGSNLPHVIRAFKQRDPVLFEQWVRHVGTAVEGLESVDVWERPEDRSLVLRAAFRGEHREPVPSWMLSDGTLRLMALTLVSYAATEEDPVTYLIEEPENGLHPLAIQVVHEALSKPPAGVQVLCATHSPIFLAQTELEQVLVFRRAAEGHAVVRRATEVPELREWTGQVNLADLFVTGLPIGDCLGPSEPGFGTSSERRLERPEGPAA